MHVPSQYFVLQHEDQSVLMFEHLLENNPKVKDAFDQLLDDRDIGFIKEQIAGPAPSQGYQHRDASSHYLYEVRVHIASYDADVIACFELVGILLNVPVYYLSVLRAF